MILGPYPYIYNQARTNHPLPSIFLSSFPFALKLSAQAYIFNSFLFYLFIYFLSFFSLPNQKNYIMRRP